jgi:hypothetical protein
MVVVGGRNEQANDAISLRIQRQCPVVRPSFELYFDFYIDVLYVEIVQDSSELLAF